MNGLPALSTATHTGDSMLALVAGPPSPKAHQLDVPLAATVVMTPVPAPTRRMTIVR